MTPVCDSCAVTRPTISRRRIILVHHTLAAVVYLGASLLLFGWFVVGDITGRTVGVGSDPAFFAWSIGWWPHALVDGVNPLHLDAVFAPDGVPAAWATSVPVPSFFAAPILALAGPVAATNVLFLLAPATAAFAAYLLCRELSGNAIAAMVGGWLYGFSTFVGAHMLGHLNLVLVLWIPLLVLVAIRVARGTTSRCRGTIAFAVVLACQLGTSTELALQATTFGLLAIAVIAVFAPTQRMAIRRVLVVAIPGWLVGGLIAAPLLLQQVLAGSTGWHPARRADSQDLFGLVIPDRMLLIDPGNVIAERFTSGLAERGAYLSVFGVALIAVFAFRARGTFLGRTLPVLALVAFLFALGPLLHVAGRELPVPLPAAGFIVIPIINLMITGRFGLFMSLVLGITAAVAISDVRMRYWALPIALLAAIATLPNPVSPLRWSDATTPSALAAGASGPVGHERLIILPPEAGMRWQAVGNYGYTQVGGYTGVILPSAYRPWQDVLDGLAGRRALPSAERFTAYVEAFGADAVILGPGAAAGATALLTAAGYEVEQSGGVEVWRRR